MACAHSSSKPSPTWWPWPRETAPVTRRTKTSSERLARRGHPACFTGSTAFLVPTEYRISLVGQPIWLDLNRREQLFIALSCRWSPADTAEASLAAAGERLAEQSSRGGLSCQNLGIRRRLPTGVGHRRRVSELAVRREEGSLVPGRVVRAGTTPGWPAPTRGSARACRDGRLVRG